MVVQCVSKKQSLAKYDYWRYFMPIYDIPFNLLRYHRIPGHVKALQDTLCTYSVAYSPYKPTIGANTNKHLSLNILSVSYTHLTLPTKRIV